MRLRWSVPLGLLTSTVGVGCALFFKFEEPDGQAATSATSSSGSTSATASSSSSGGGGDARCAAPPDAGVACPGKNLDGDPENCGRCGHDCRGGACQSGHCQPVVLAQAVHVAASRTPPDGQGAFQFIDAVEANACTPGFRIDEIRADGSADAGAARVLVECQDILGYWAASTDAKLFFTANDKLFVADRSSLAVDRFAPEPTGAGVAVVNNAALGDLVVYLTTPPGSLLYKPIGDAFATPGVPLNAVNTYARFGTPAFDGNNLLWIDEAKKIRAVPVHDTVGLGDSVLGQLAGTAWSRIEAGRNEILAIADDRLVRVDTSPATPSNAHPISGWTIAAHDGYRIKGAAYAPDGIGWFEVELNDAGTEGVNSVGYFRRFCGGPEERVFEQVANTAGFLAIDATAFYYSNLAAGFSRLAR